MKSAFVYEGENIGDAWIGRFTFNNAINDFVIANCKQDSFTMLQEWPYSALEYAKNKVIVTIVDRVILLEDWECVRVYKDSHNSFKDRGYITVLPGFNATTFPFVALAGSHSINLLNLNRSAM